MSQVYKRGNTVTHYCSFVKLDGSEPSTVLNPKVTIIHVDADNNIIFDINEQDMTLAAENTYYFKWAIPESAFLGEYNLECQATLDGEYGEYNEVIQVVS